MKVGSHLDVILTLVAEECGERVEDILSSCRRIELVQCRMIYASIAWQLLEVPLREIGRPIRRCVSSVQAMIVKSHKVVDRLYLASYRRVKVNAERQIFRDSE